MFDVSSNTLRKSSKILSRDKLVNSFSMHFIFANGRISNNFGWKISTTEELIKDSVL